MIKTNKERLPKISAVGQVVQPNVSKYYYTWMDDNGYGRLMVASGGITYNYQIGDNCMNIDGNLVEPGVSVHGATEALNVYGCIGNEAIITTGDAKGAKGYLTGKRYSQNNVMFYFQEEDMEKMNGEEKILVKCFGTGMKFIDFPMVEVMNLDPVLFEKMRVTQENGCLVVPVTKIIPSYLISAGTGSLPFIDDCDIITDDEKCFEKYGLSALRFGDVVMIQDLDTTHGRAHLQGAVTIGTIVHSDSIALGNGPGVTTVFSSKQPVIRGYIDENANIANYLGVARKEFGQSC